LDWQKPEKPRRKREEGIPPESHRNDEGKGFAGEKEFRSLTCPREEPLQNFKKKRKWPRQPGNLSSSQKKNEKGGPRGRGKS